MALVNLIKKSKGTLSQRNVSYFIMKQRNTKQYTKESDFLLSKVNLKDRKSDNKTLVYIPDFWTSQQQ